MNIHRQVLHSIFEHARRSDTFGLRDNPVAGTTKRPEEGTEPIEVFDPAEIRAIADAARSGFHRKRSGYAHSVFSDETKERRQRDNDQDAALFIVAGCTGLRMGELLALRWSDIDLKGSMVTASRAMSAGKESSTKSRRFRPIPLADQAASALRELQKRPAFRSRHDFVFAGQTAAHSTDLEFASASSVLRRPQTFELDASMICATPSAAWRSSSSTSSPSRT